MNHSLLFPGPLSSTAKKIVTIATGTTSIFSEMEFFLNLDPYKGLWCYIKAIDWRTNGEEHAHNGGRWAEENKFSRERLKIRMGAAFARYPKRDFSSADTASSRSIQPRLGPYSLVSVHTTVKKELNQYPAF